MARVAKKNREKKEKAEEILPVNAVSLPLQKAEAIIERKNIPDDAFLAREEFEKLLGEVKNMTFEEVLERTEGVDLSPGQKVHMLKSWAERQKGGVVAVNNEPGFLKTTAYGMGVIAKKLFVGVKDGAPSWFFHVWSTLFAGATRVRVMAEKNGKTVVQFWESRSNIAAATFIPVMVVATVMLLAMGPITTENAWSWGMIGFYSLYFLGQFASLCYEIGRKSLKDSNK